MSVGSAERIHIWNRCHACGAAPIVGLRLECQTCPAGGDNDLCRACYRRFEQGQVEHPLPDARESPPGRHVFLPLEGIEPDRVLPWLAVPWANAPAPDVPDRCVVRPEFCSGRESFFGSYGFIVAAQDGPLLLTALHVLDELAKFRHVDCSDRNTAYTGRELLAHVTGVRLYDPFAARWMLAEIGTADAMLALPDARICGAEPYSQRDVAAFRIDPVSAFRPLRLADEPCRPGQPIWLAVSPGQGSSLRTQPAVVVEATPETFVFRFAPQATRLRHSSGAPLLNAAGEVVAINVGGGRFDGHELGHGAHVASIRRHLGS